MKTKSKKSKPVVADLSPEKLARLKALNERLHGAFPNFMSQDDLRKLRENDKWAAYEAKSKQMLR